MKKLLFILTFIIYFGTNNLFCQNEYYKLIVNEKVTFQKDTLNSFLIVINKIKIDDLIKLKSIYIVSYYKDTTIYNFNKNYVINLNELPNVFEIEYTKDFTEGDLFYKATNELKKYLINIYNWKENNLIIY